MEPAPAPGEDFQWVQMSLKGAQVPNDTCVRVSTTGNDANEIVMKTLIGDYAKEMHNHGRPVYRKLWGPGVPNPVTVMLYYWDCRDGEQYMGWWLGNKIGGTQVWAKCWQNTMLPPAAGWRIPWNGPVRATLLVATKVPYSAASATEHSQTPPWRTSQSPAQSAPAQLQQSQKQCPLQQSPAGDGDVVCATVQAITGSYFAVSKNHGRAVYQKMFHPTERDGCAVSLYHWDASKGVRYEGWWFGYGVGGDHVWSYCGRSTFDPPRAGWRIPWYSPVVSDLVVTPTTFGVDVEHAAAKFHRPQLLPTPGGAARNDYPTEVSATMTRGGSAGLTPQGKRPTDFTATSAQDAKRRKQNEQPLPKQTPRQDHYFAKQRAGASGAAGAADATSTADAAAGQAKKAAAAPEEYEKKLSRTVGWLNKLQDYRICWQSARLYLLSLAPGKGFRLLKLVSERRLTVDSLYGTWTADSLDGPATKKQRIL